MIRISLDSNILVYSIDPRDPVRQRSAIAIIEALGHQDGVLTLQAMAEFLHAAVRKRIASAAVASARLDELSKLFAPPAVANAVALQAARRGWLTGRFSLWDALLLATADAAGCKAVISEDMADGATLGEVHVIGAFDRDGAVSPAARAALGLA